MSGGADWITGGSKSGGAKTPPAPKPPPPKGGTSNAASGGASWITGGSSSSAQTSAAAKPKSLLGQLKSVVSAVPSGFVHLGKDLGTEAKAAVSPSHLPIIKAFVAAPKPRPGETQHEFKLRTAPIGTQTAESFKRTGSDIVHPTHFAQASKQGNIVSKILEDAANASIVLGPVAKGAGSIAERTAATAAEEGTAGATARATAARVAAKGLHGAAVGTEAVASAPIKPLQLATTGIEAGPVLSRLPGVVEGDKFGVMPLAAKGFNHAAAGDSVVGHVARLARIDLDSRLLRREALTPAMDAQSEAVGRQVALGRQVAQKLQSPVEEQAMHVLAEGQAPALAKLRDQLPDRFDAFVAEHFGDTLSPAAAHLAADVASGKAPEAAARIDEALRIGRVGAGGREERSAQYLAAKPGREWQTGFAPDQRVIDTAIEKPMAQLPKAEKLARALRQRADAASSALEGAKADASAALEAKAADVGASQLEAKRATLESAVSRQQDRAVASADRLTSLRDLHEAAKLGPPRKTPSPTRVDVGAQRLTRTLTGAERRRAVATAGEEQLVRNAEHSVPTVAEQVERDRSTLRAKYVKAAGERADQVRNDLAQFFADGPLGKVDLKVTQADWVRNLPAHVRQALQRGVGLVEDAGTGGGLGPDEFMHNARRVNASLSGMSDEQIAEHIAQLYEEYRSLRAAPRVRAEEIRGSHLRSAGIADPYLEAIASPTPAGDVAGWLQEQGIAPPPAEVQRRQGEALGAAGDVMVKAEQLAADTLHAGGSRADVVTAARDELGAEGARLAGRHFDRMAAEVRVPAARGKLTGLFDRQGEDVGRLGERAAQGGRLARLEARNANSLRTKLEALPDEASPAHVSPTYGTGKQLGRLDAQASNAQALAGRSEAVLGRLRDRVRTTAETAAASVDAAPARLRPAIQTNRAVTAEFTSHANELRAQGLADSADKITAAAAEIPTTLKALEAAGVDPEHFIHVKGGDRPSAGGARTGGLPRIVKGRDEKFRADSLHFDRSVRAQTQGEIDAAKNVIARQTAEKIATMPFAAKLGEGTLQGATTAAEAAQAGYVPWNPATIFEKGRVSIAEARTVEAGGVGTTVFVPEHIFKGFRSYFGSNAVDDILRKTYDPAIQGIKVAQLALSPSWQINNIIGNTMMATLGAGVNPVQLAVAIKDAVKAYRASGPKGARNLEDTVPRRLLTAGPTHSEFQFLHAPQDQPLGRFPKLQQALHAAGAPARASYALNGFVDNIGRSAVYLAKKGQGLSDEAAVRASLKAMGDFSRMTPIEQRVVRRVIPYYAWSRHITQLAFSLPIEHPLRVAWTLHLADQFADPDTRDLPGSLAGAIKLPGNKLLGAGRLFPFGDAGRILEPAGIASQVSPILKVVGENTPIPTLASQGINSSTGKPYSRPPGTGRHDDFGGSLPTSPSIAHQVGGLFPQKRLLDSLTGRDKVARYDTGDKVLTKDGPIPTGKTGGLGLLRFLGLPVTDAKQGADMAKRVADKQLANDKAKAGYDKKRKAKR